MLKSLSIQPQASRLSLETPLSVEAHVESIINNYEKIVEKAKDTFFKNRLKLLITVMNEAFLSVVGDNNGVRERIQTLKNKNLYPYTEQFQNVPDYSSQPGSSSHSQPGPESSQAGSSSHSQFGPRRSTRRSGKGKAPMVNPY